LRVVASGVIDDADCAFPQAALTGGGEVVCIYCRGGGQFATGQSVVARSRDDGRSWFVEGPVITPPGRQSPGGSPTSASTMLRASSRTGSDIVFAYGARSSSGAEDRFGERPVEPILCISSDRGRTWSAPRVLAAPTRMLEISHGVLPTGDGRLLAPAATIDPGRLGAQVLLAASEDDGVTWGPYVPVLEDPRGRRGYLEHKLTDLGDGRLLLTAWTVLMDDLTDLPNTFALSLDSGRTWGPASSTGIRGQTLSTVWLGGDRLLVLYNRRYGRQGVVAALATLTEAAWVVHDEVLVHDPGTDRQRELESDGVDEMVQFTFGFPTGILLPDGQVLVTYWAGPYGRTAICWARIDVAGPSSVA
jgi:hypothetical protein